MINEVEEHTLEWWNLITTTLLEYFHHLRVLFKDQIQEMSLLDLTLSRSIYFSYLFAEHTNLQYLNDFFLWTNPLKFLNSAQCVNVLFEGLYAG